MQHFKKGDHVEVRGTMYGSYDGEIGRIYGDVAPCQGEEAFDVDMRGEAVIVALAKDLRLCEPPKGKGKRIKRLGA